jgi:hypothetical protein
MVLSGAVNKRLVNSLVAAGVPVEHLACRGQIHTSVTAVDVILSAAHAREAVGAALR